MTKIQYRRFKGKPLMTERMMGLLQGMREAKRVGFPFFSLEGIHKNTINAAMEHDWIFESPGLDGIRYTITGRGESDLALYETPKLQYRTDGLCPDCQERPRSTRSTGQLAPYCLECGRKRSRQTYHTAEHHPLSILCPTCETRHRQQRDNGRFYGYCKECRRAHRIAERKVRRSRDLERAQNGEFLPCRRCKVCPRWVTANTVQDYCYKCAQFVKREQMLKRILRPSKVRPAKTADMCCRKGCYKPRRVSKNGFVYPYCFKHSRQLSRRMYEQSKKAST